MSDANDLFGSDSDDGGPAPPPASDSAPKPDDRVIGKENDSKGKDGMDVDAANPPAPEASGAAVSGGADPKDVRPEGGPASMDVDDKKKYKDMFGSDSEGSDDEPSAGVAPSQDARPDPADVKPEPKPVAELEPEIEKHTIANLTSDPALAALGKELSQGALYLSRSGVTNPGEKTFVRVARDAFTAKSTAEEEGEHVIRWRYKDGVEGGPLESNARLLEWEDGSLTLQVGSEQIVVQRQPLMGVAHIASVKQAGFVQGCVRIDKAIAFKPKDIRKMVKRAPKSIPASQKKRKVQLLSHIKENPEEQKRKLEAAEQKRIKDEETQRKKQERQLAKYGLTPSQMHGTRMSKNFLNSEDEDSEGLDWDDGDATAAARSNLAIRRRSMGDAEGEDRITRAKMEPVVQEHKRQKFNAGLDESDDDDGGGDAGGSGAAAGGLAGVSAEEGTPSKARGRPLALDLSDDED